MHRRVVLERPLVQAAAQAQRRIRARALSGAETGQFRVTPCQEI